MLKRITFKTIIIAGLLLGAWVVLTALYLYQRPDLTVISKDFDKKILTSLPQEEFLKGQKIKAEFVASENYLGQVSVRFYNYDRINSDEVIFRIKEKGANDWYYENVYKTNQFQPHALFPFGFPIIQDAIGKSYIVEIESVKGTLEDAVTLDTAEPIFSTSYQYPKSEFKNPSVFLEFLIKKITYNKYDLDFFVGTGIYINFIILSLLLIYLFVDYLFEHIHILVGPKSEHAIVLGLVLIALNAVVLYLRKPELSATLAIAGYFLLVAGVIWLIIETKFFNAGKPAIQESKKKAQKSRQKRV